ncbi:MAG: exo-alpha-sialidase [Clostridia bacterium]|nr:exo-alpha-sialidase [Clostridia bacterium]
MTINVDAIRGRMTNEDIAELKRIYEPTVVASPFSDALTDLAVMPDGEIRCYGYRPLDDEPDGKKERVYIRSVDGGLSWKTVLCSENALGAAVKSPWSERWLAFFKKCAVQHIGVSEIGPDDKNYLKVPSPIQNVGVFRQPTPIPQIKRWIIPVQFNDEAEGCGDRSAVLISDDDGDSWRVVKIEQSDKFEVKPPHLSPRWENSGIEPEIDLLDDGTLAMILRTSTDYIYICYSYDFGDSWTKPQPTTLHMTLTTPAFLHLQDGRIMIFYNNTQPLPEFDKKSVWPPLSQNEIKGVYEDVFTNRDSSAVVISEDNLKSFIGFREMYLNPLRNHADFRSFGGNGCGRDKSVHQFQAIELPFNKVLVHIGQHQHVRKLVIFDVDWVYEKGRSENFRQGLESLSTQVYLKSVTGNYRGFTGHCAWNRTNGSLLVPDPSGDHTEALLIRNTDDDRLFSNVQGAVWNFPAAKQGSVTVKAKVLGEGLRVSLMDRWMNPVDITVSDCAAFTSVITADDTVGDGYTSVTIDYDTEKGEAILTAGENKYALRIGEAAPNGVCYIHLQTATETGDSKGSLIKSLNMQAK